MSWGFNAGAGQVTPLVACTTTLLPRQSAAAPQTEFKALQSLLLHTLAEPLLTQLHRLV